MTDAGDYADLRRKVIRARREAAGLTQAQLADLIGVTPVTIYRWETRGLPPSHRNRHALARQLGGTPGDYG